MLGSWSLFDSYCLGSSCDLRLSMVMPAHLINLTICAKLVGFEINAFVSTLMKIDNLAGHEIIVIKRDSKRSIILIDLE